MKFYFLCEGKKDGAEYTFVQSIINLYRVDEVYELQGAGGKNNILNTFNKYKKNLNAGDVFILFFDNIEDTKDSNTTDIVIELIEECETRGIIFRHTKYYCFEELFLSYIGLVSVIKKDNLEVVNNLNILQNSLINKEDYFSNMAICNFWIDYLKRKGTIKETYTREQLSALILNKLTNSTFTNDGFSIEKGYIGSCWISNCNSTQLHPSICSKCTFCKKDTNFKDKLDDLHANSVAKLWLPFSTIFAT